MKFGRLSDLIDNRKTLKANKVLRFSFMDRSVQELVLDLNRDYQLFSQGIDANGNEVGYYKKFTEEMYQGQSFSSGGAPAKQKIAGEKYFFYDTGKLFDSFFIRIDDDGVIIGNTDLEKLEDIMLDPSRLLGLTEESREALIIEILPAMRDYIIRHLLS